MDCKYCGSDVVDYVGIDDGGGDYGESVCDQYECLECGARFEADCIGEGLFYAINGMDEQEAFNNALLSDEEE